MSKVTILSVMLFGCIHARAIDCEDERTCPGGLVCDTIHHGCITQVQLDACGEAGDPAFETLACSLDASAATDGFCHDGICLPVTCDDGFEDGDEVCDSGPPTVGTCTDESFDYGTLGCSDICSPDTSTCGRIGWRFEAIPSMGNVGGFYRLSSGDLLAVTQSAIVRRRDGFLWESEPVPTPGMIPVGIWGSGDHVFVVGTTYAQNPDGDGAIWRFDGTTWTGLTLPEKLSGVWGRSATDVYAVGGDSNAPRIYHFDGSAWTPMVVNASSQTGLGSVWGTGTRTFAAGASTLGGTYFFLELQADRTWVQSGGAFPFLITALWGSADELFAGGGRLLHFDGNSWAEMVTGWENANGISVGAIRGRSPTDVYAVGAFGGNGAYHVMHYDGETWVNEVTPLDFGQKRPAVVYADDDDVFVAGNANLVISSSAVRWGVSKLTPQLGVFGISGDAAGTRVTSVGDGCLVYDSSDGYWSEDTALCTCGSPPTFLLDVDAPTATTQFVVGPYGFAGHKTATGWKCDATPKNDWLWGVWAASATDAIGVGSTGDNANVYVVHWNGTAWTDWTPMMPMIPSGTAMHPIAKLDDVWGIGASDVFAVGRTDADEAALVHYDGTAWTAMATPAGTPALRAIWGTAHADVFAVGDDGTILHFDGTGWTRMFVPRGVTISTQVSLSSVVGRSASDVYVVGLHTLLHYDGRGWGTVTREDIDEAELVWPAAKQVYIAGDQLGAIHQLMGTLP